MSTQPSQISSFTQHALAHAKILSASGRGSATPAEKRAADYVQNQLKSLGVKDIRLQPFLGERSVWLFVSMAFGIALVGHAAYWLLRRPAGVWVAVVISVLAFGLSGFMVWRKFTLEDYPLHNNLPRGPSQNVLGILPPSGDVRQRLVLVSHLDTHRAVFWFATDFLVKLFGPVSMIAVFGVFAAIPLYILAVLTHVQLFAWLGLVLAVFHFVSWFSGVTADLGQYSPGANDNASSVGTVLSLAEHLVDQPLHNTEVWLAFTGCEENSGDGILTLIKESGEQLKDAVFIDLEMVGIGDQVSYIRTEGNITRYTIPPELEALVKEVGQDYGLGTAIAPIVGASTECGILLKYGFKAFCLIANYRGSNIMPEWHRLTDTPDKLQASSMERINILTWELLQRLDQGWI